VESNDNQLCITGRDQMKPGGSHLIQYHYFSFSTGDMQWKHFLSIPLKKESIKR
jgi:hypothetical protein